MSKPDFARLQQIADEADRLADAGAFTEEAFERLLEEADKAAAGEPELIEFMANRGALYGYLTDDE